MKKSILAIGLFCILSLPATAMAAPPSPLVPVQESAPENERESLLRELGLAQEEEPEAVPPAPVAVERRNIDGTEYIIKVFETADDIAPEKLVSCSAI